MTNDALLDLCSPPPVKSRTLQNKGPHCLIKNARAPSRNLNLPFPYIINILKCNSSHQLRGKNLSLGNSACNFAEWTAPFFILFGAPRSPKVHEWNFGAAASRNFVLLYILCVPLGWTKLIVERVISRLQ